MANRFTEDKKWGDAWFSKLSPKEKLLFLYLIDSCDLAGFIEIDMRMFTFMTGLNEEDIVEALKGLKRGYLGAKEGQWIWIKNFIKYQRNLPLNPENGAHKNIFTCIYSQKDRFDLKPIYDFLGAKEGLFSPISISKGKVKVTKGVQGETKKLVEQFANFAFNGYEDIKSHALLLAETIDNGCTRIQQLEEPLTPTQVCELIKTYGGKITGILRDMDNWKPLLEKNTSAYKTALKWIQKK